MGPLAAAPAVGGATERAQGSLSPPDTWCQHEGMGGCGHLIFSHQMVRGTWSDSLELMCDREQKCCLQDAEFLPELSGAGLASASWGQWAEVGCVHVQVIQ